MKGALGGLVLAYALLIARRMIDRRIRSVKDVEEATGSSVIGIIPKVDVARSRATAASAATSARRPRRSASCAPTCASSTSTTPRAGS